MIDVEIRDLGDGTRVVLVLVGVQGDLLGLGQGDGEEPGDLALDGARVGAPEGGLEDTALALLGGGHGAGAAQLGVGEAVAEVRVPADEGVEQRGVELAPLEGLERVHDERLGDATAGSMPQMVQQRVTTEPGAVQGDGLGRGPELAGDLAEGGASQQAVQGGQQQLGTLEPVGGAERLVTEVTPAVTAAVAPDTVRRGEAGVVAGAMEAPSGRAGTVEITSRVGTEGRCLGGVGVGHALSRCNPRSA